MKYNCSFLQCQLKLSSVEDLLEFKKGHPQLNLEFFKKFEISQDFV